LSIFDAPGHPHHRQRKTFVDLDGVTQPAPAPRFSRTPPEVRHAARCPGDDSETVLLDYGFSRADIETFRAKGVIPTA